MPHGTRGVLSVLNNDKERELSNFLYNSTEFIDDIDSIKHNMKSVKCIEFDSLCQIIRSWPIAALAFEHDLQVLKFLVYDPLV